MPEDISSIIWVKVRTKKTITCKTSRKTFLEIAKNEKICLFDPSIQFHSKNVKTY